MIEAVFISDLHLHPDEPEILRRFESFVVWAGKNTHSVYILGDFFHAWPGDDASNEWSEKIARQLAGLSQQGLKVYFMAGNRDFLIGSQFLNRAKLRLLTEPTIITLGGHRILLVHGDRYCTRDKGHQWFRCLTRNEYFISLFLRLPLSWRNQLVAKVRRYSQTNVRKPVEKMEVVLDDRIQHMKAQQVKTVIHGHIHVFGLTKTLVDGHDYHQYVLSDWDDSPQLLCYNQTEGFRFVRLEGKKDE